MKSEIVKLLDTLADYYTVANDSPRVRAFRKGARNIELLSNLSKEKIKDLDLGKSTKEVIEEFLETNSSSRLEELKAKYPPIKCLDLLHLYNFDLQYLFELWDKYKASTLPELYPLRSQESRVKIALDILSSLNMQYIKLPETALPLLGDLAVHSAYGSGELTVDRIIEVYKERDYKHGFIADFYSSPNVIGSLSRDRILSQQQAIKDAQIKHNIRIWQGLIVDADLQGNVPTDLPQTDYVILKLSTKPHENVVERIKKAASQIKTPIILDILDKYCHHMNKQDFMELSSKFPIILHAPDYVTSTILLSYLHDVPPFKVALVSYSKNEYDFDEIFLAQDLAARLGIPPDKIVNCLPSPFSSGPLYSSSVGVRQKESTQTPEDSLKKLEATFQKIQQLRSSKNHLGHLFQKDKK